MNDPFPQSSEQPPPPRRFTLRLIDGHFVRVPALGTVSINGRHRPAVVQLLHAAKRAEEQNPAPSSFTAIPASFSPRYKGRKPAAEA